tara:strand:- start:180 stop:482 length:303 start_codon:yes stop_codon:yes gene_type:complete
MTEATQRPWDVEFAATKSYDLIYSGSRMDSTTIARVPWTGKAEDRANTELIVKAVNNLDALVAEATELLKNTTWDEDSVGYARVLTQDIEALNAALEQVK